jgi:DNA damage-binding protein 1
MGDCLVLANPKGLSVTKINSLKKLSVQTFDLHDRSAGKLVSLDEQRLLGVGSTVRKMDDETGEVVQSGFFELRDPATLRCEFVDET